MAIFEENAAEAPEWDVTWLKDGGLKLTIKSNEELRQQGGELRIESVRDLSVGRVIRFDRETLSRVDILPGSSSTSRSLTPKQLREKLQEVESAFRRELRFRVIVNGLSVIDERVPDPIGAHWLPPQMPQSVRAQDPLDSASGGPRRILFEPRNPNPYPMNISVLRADEGEIGYSKVGEYLLPPESSSLVVDADAPPQGCEYYAVAPSGVFGRVAWKGSLSGASVNGGFSARGLREAIHRPGRASSRRDLLNAVSGTPEKGLTTQRTDGVEVRFPALPKGVAGIQVFRGEIDLDKGLSGSTGSLGGSGIKLRDRLLGESSSPPGDEFSVFDGQALIPSRVYHWTAVLLMADGSRQTVRASCRRWADASDIELSARLDSDPCSGAVKAAVQPSASSRTTGGRIGASPEVTLERISGLGDLEIGVGLELTSKGIDRITNLLQRSAPEVVQTAFGEDIDNLRSSLSSLLFLDVRLEDVKSGRTVNLGRYSKAELEDAGNALRWSPAELAELGVDFTTRSFVTLTPLMLDPVVALETQDEERPADFRSRVERLRRFFGPLATNFRTLPTRNRVIRARQFRVSPILATLDEERLGAAAKEIMLPISGADTPSATLSLTGVEVGSKRKPDRGSATRDVNIKWSGNLGDGAVIARATLTKQTPEGSQFSESRTYLLRGDRGVIRFTLPKVDVEDSDLAGEQPLARVKLEAISDL